MGAKETVVTIGASVTRRNLLPLTCANVKTGYIFNMYKVNKFDLNINFNVSAFREAGRKLNYFRLFWIMVLLIATILKIALEK